MYIYFINTGLEINGTHRKMRITWDNCESLWQNESQTCKSLLADLRIIFQIVSQRDLF